MYLSYSQFLLFAPHPLALEVIREKGASPFDDQGLPDGRERAHQGASLGKRGQEQPDTTYDLFKNILPSLTEHKPPQIDRTKLEAIDDIRTRAKLEALLALLDLGLSIPEACTRSWGDVNFERRELTRYHRQRVEISAEAIGALEALLAVMPKTGWPKYRRIFGWSAVTARRWLKLVRAD